MDLRTPLSENERLTLALSDIKNAQEEIRERLVLVGQYVADPGDLRQDADGYRVVLESLFQAITYLEGLDSAAGTIEQAIHGPEDDR